jgi:hypothetical protein
MDPAPSRARDLLLRAGESFHSPVSSFVEYKKIQTALLRLAKKRCFVGAAAVTERSLSPVIL